MMRILIAVVLGALTTGCTKQEAQQSMERIRTAAGVDQQLVVVSNPGYELDLIVTRLAVFSTLADCQSAAVALTGGTANNHRVSASCLPVGGE